MMWPSARAFAESRESPHQANRIAITVPAKLLADFAFTEPASDKKAARDLKDPAPDVLIGASGNASIQPPAFAFSLSDRSPYACSVILEHPLSCGPPRRV